MRIIIVTTDKAMAMGCSEVRVNNNKRKRYHSPCTQIAGLASYRHTSRSDTSS